MIYKIKNDYLDEVVTVGSMDEVVDYVTSCEIIYYHKAMSYLLDKDASLVESFALADGLNITDLNSVLLATLHYQDSLFSNLEEIES